MSKKESVARFRQRFLLYSSISQAIGLVSALSNMGSNFSLNFIESFSLRSSTSDRSKTFSCGNFKYAILYIQSCGINESSNQGIIFDNAAFLSPNMSEEMAIYSISLKESINTPINNPIKLAIITTTANSISLTVKSSNLFMTGAIMSFN